MRRLGVSGCDAPDGVRISTVFGGCSLRCAEVNVYASGVSRVPAYLRVRRRAIGGIGGATERIVSRGEAISGWVHLDARAWAGTTMSHNQVNAGARARTRYTP